MISRRDGVYSRGMSVERLQRMESDCPYQGKNVVNVDYGNVDFGSIPSGMKLILRLIAIISISTRSSMDSAIHPSNGNIQPFTVSWIADYMYKIGAPAARRNLMKVLVASNESVRYAMKLLTHPT